MKVVGERARAKFTEGNESKFQNDSGGMARDLADGAAEESLR